MRHATKLLIVLVLVLRTGLSRTEDVTLKCDEFERIYDSTAGEPFCTVSGFSVSHSQNIRIQHYVKGNMTKFMKFYDSRLLYVPYKLFDAFVNLKTLDVSFTQILDVPRNTFGAANNLTYLNMSNNNITQLSTSVFVGANNLMRLDLSRNQITDINEYAFNGLTNLDKLQLSHNKLRTLSKDVFLENPYVETVALDGNLLEYIEPEVFSRLRRIRDVNLAENVIHRIHPNTFESAYALETLTLSSNLLNEFQLTNRSIINQLNLDRNNLTSVFINATKVVRANYNRITQVRVINAAFLEMIMISNNRLSDISNITNLSSLLHLDLSENPILPLNVSTFANLKRLRLLFLRRTGLRELNFGMFSKQTDLEVLDLSYNNLTTLNLDMFVPYLFHLKSFFVDANNLTELQGKHSFSQAFPNLETLGVSRNRFNCSYLHSLLIEPSLRPTVMLKIEHDNSDAEVSHIRDVSCVSTVRQTLQHAEDELENLNQLQQLINQSMEVMRVHEQRLQIYLLVLKITLLAMVCLALGVAVTYFWKQRHNRSGYMLRGSGGSIVFHSNATVNTSTDHA